VNNSDFSCSLTKVFTHFGIELVTETPSIEKESFGSASINKIFLPRNNFDKIMNGESKAEKEARLKKTHHEKIPGGKKKKADIKEEDIIPISSDSEERISRKANKKEYIKLRKEINGSKDKFNNFRRQSKLIYLKSNEILTDSSRSWAISTLREVTLPVLILLLMILTNLMTAPIMGIILRTVQVKGRGL